MSSPEPNHDFKFGLEHVEKLLDRRQAITTFYLSVNAGIASIVGLLLKDAQLKQEWLLISVLLLLGAGLITCWIWRSLLQQYAILLDWWYARLREMKLSCRIPRNSSRASIKISTSRRRVAKLPGESA